MAAFDHVRPARSSGLGSLFVKAFGLALTWNEQRKTAEALHALSDRELDDIGLSRGDIDRVVAEV